MTARDGSPPRSSSGSSRRRRTPTGRSGARRRGSTRATARSPSSSRTGRCSASGRSTTRSRRSAGGRCGSSTRPCGPRCGSAPTSSPSWTASRRTRRSTRRSSSCARRGSSAPSPSRTRSCAGSPRGCPSLLAAPARGERRPRPRSCHSYPDWVAETWWRDLGADDARALMRAQNEPPETSPCARAGAGRRVVVERSRRSGSRAGYAWPQSRGSQLAGAAVGARPGERVLDLCAAPGGKATQLAAAGAEVVAVEKHPGRARELEANARGSGVELTVVNADALELPDEPRRLRPGARRRAVLGLGVLDSRPDLRWRAEPLPELQLGAPARPRRSGCGRAARSRTPSARSTAPRTRTSSTRSACRVDDLGAELAGVPPSAAARSSCSRCRTCTARPGSSCALRRSRRVTEPPRKLHAVAWRDWIRTVEIEPSALRRRLLAPRRAGPPPARTPARAIFHFDVGDGHFVEPITIGPVVLQCDRADRPRGAAASSTAT